MRWDALDRRRGAGVAVVVATAIASAVAAPALPGAVATHWNAAGEVDGTTPRSVLLVGGPALVAGTALVFEGLPRIDPLGENVAAFQDAYDATAVLVTGFLAYVDGFLLASNAGYEVAVGRALSPAVAVLLVGVGSLLERAEQNWFVGVRTPWTLSSAVVWRRTHDLSATLFKLAGVVALGGLVRPDLFVYLVAGPAAVITVVATVYSYVVYTRVDGGERPGEG
ncbi:MAG: SdpI family protein [Halobacteriaceae archaeon]